MKLLIALAVVASLQTSEGTIGYLVVEKTHNEYLITKTLSVDSVSNIADKYHVNADSLLRVNNYFEVRTDWESLYVEKKRVVKCGNKLKFKKL